MAKDLFLTLLGLAVGYVCGLLRNRRPPNQSGRAPTGVRRSVVRDRLADFITYNGTQVAERMIP